MEYLCLELLLEEITPEMEKNSFYQSMKRGSFLENRVINSLTPRNSKRLYRYLVFVTIWKYVSITT